MAFQSSARLTAVLMALMFLGSLLAAVPGGPAEARGAMVEGFGSGSEADRYITFPPGGGADKGTTLEVPAGTPLYSAGFIVEGGPAGGDSWPTGVTIDVGADGDSEWEFPSWPGAGALGRQDTFSGGSRWMEEALPPTGTSMGGTTYLPAGALADVAGLEVRGDSDYFFTSTSIDDNSGFVGEMRAGDLDSDGDNDLAVLLKGGGELGWYENVDSAGASWKYSPIDSEELTSPGNGTGISSFTITDWDGDGSPDLLVCGDNGIMGSFRNVAGSLQGESPWNYTRVTTNTEVVFWVEGADMDGDGDTDAVTAAAPSTGSGSHSLRIYLQLTESEGGPGVEMVSLDSLSEVFAGELIDADGDAYPDLVSAVRLQGQPLEPMLILYEDPGLTSEGSSTGSGRNIIADTGITSPEDVAVADVDGDGSADVVCLDSPGLTWYRNPGTGTNWTSDVIDASVSGESLATGVIPTVIEPFPALADVIVASPSNDAVWWYRNPAGPSGGKPWDFTQVAWLQKARLVVVADMDGKGGQDVVSCAGTTGVLDWFDLEHSAPSGVKVSVDGGEGLVTLWEQPAGQEFMLDMTVAEASMSPDMFTSILAAPGSQSTVADGYGNIMVGIPFKFTSVTPGLLNVSAPGISYTYQPVVSVRPGGSLLEEINEHLEDATSGREEGGGVVKVPVRVTSLSAGELRLSGLRLGYNAPPEQVSQPSVVKMKEGTGPVHLDVLRHFTDDHTVRDDLTAWVARVHRPGLEPRPLDDAVVEVVQGSTLRVDLRDSDFFGELEVVLEVYDDGSPNDDPRSVMSAPVLLEVSPVNDEPVRGENALTSFGMPEGRMSHILDLAGGGHFFDADDDPLEFTWLVDPDDAFDDNLKVIHTADGSFSFISEGNWIGGPVPVTVYADDIVPEGVDDPAHDDIDTPFWNFGVTVVNADDDSPFWDPLPHVKLAEDSAMGPYLDLGNYVKDTDTPAEDIDISLISCSSWGITPVVGRDGMLWLEPQENYFGTCMLTLQADDGTSDTQSYLTVEVTPVNDLPEVSIETPLRSEKFSLPAEGDGVDAGVPASIHVSGKASDIEDLRRVSVRLYRPSDGLFTRWYWARGLDNWDVSVPLDDLPGPGEYIIQVRVFDGEAEVTVSREISVLQETLDPQPATDGSGGGWDVVDDLNDDWITPGDEVPQGDNVDVTIPAGDGGTPEEADLRAAAVGVAVVSAMVGALGWLTGTQQGKYSTLGFFFPLYTKLKRKKILDNFTRGRIYEYVRTHPGGHFNEIKRDLDLKNGSLTYHLMTLEREDYVKSRNSGVYKRFYLYNVKIPKRQIIKLSRIQERIVAVLLVHPGATQKEIVDITGIKQQTVNRNINQLLDYSAIRVERKGRKTHCYINLEDTCREDDEGNTHTTPGIQLVLKDCPHCGEKNTPLFHGCFNVPDSRPRKSGTPVAA